MMIADHAITQCVQKCSKEQLALAQKYSSVLRKETIVRLMTLQTLLPLGTKNMFLQNMCFLLFALGTKNIFLLLSIIVINHPSKNKTNWDFYVIVVQQGLPEFSVLFRPAGKNWFFYRNKVHQRKNANMILLILLINYKLFPTKSSLLRHGPSKLDLQRITKEFPLRAKLTVASDPNFDDFISKIYSSTKSWPSRTLNKFSSCSATISSIISKENYFCKTLVFTARHVTFGSYNKRKLSTKSIATNFQA